VDECRSLWLALEASWRAKRLSLDLREVTYVDAAGMELLQSIYGATGADMLTSSPLTAHFAEQARRQAKHNGKGE